MKSYYLGNSSHCLPTQGLKKKMGLIFKPMKTLKSVLEYPNSVQVFLRGTTDMKCYKMDISYLNNQCM